MRRLDKVVKDLGLFVLGRVRLFWLNSQVIIRKSVRPIGKLPR